MKCIICDTETQGTVQMDEYTSIGICMKCYKDNNQNIISEKLKNNFAIVSGQLPLWTKVRLKEDSKIYTIFAVKDYGGKVAYNFKEISGLYLSEDFTVIDA